MALPASRCILALRAGGNSIRSFGTEASGPLKRTSLYSLHLELGGKMVPFCGWEMPVQYKDGIMQSHLHTRKKASLFDVSHMLQLRFTGPDRVKFLESLVVADLKSLPTNKAQLSVFTTDKGGIIDDTMITNKGDHLYVVVNAGCADKDWAHIQARLKAWKGGKVEVEQLSAKNSLIALQGPSAESVLAKLVKEDVTKQPFMTNQNLNVDGIPCLVARSGYTGEDGFEISVPHDKAIALAKKLLSHADVKPAGLGPRDSLRLEAGLCLYGNDIDETTTPVEGALAWLISKQRRAEGGFPGSDVILKQLADPSLVKRKRVGMFVEGAPARSHSKVYANDKQVGEVTSGGPSPCLNKNIAMAYVQSEHSKLDTPLQVEVRGKKYPAVVTKMPFVPTSYKKI